MGLTRGIYGANAHINNRAFLKFRVKNPDLPGMAGSSTRPGFFTLSHVLLLAG
jgi:hypothetical protein